MRFGWRIVVGTLIAFLGAAFGSVGSVGGGVIFVPMLVLIIGFDSKSAVAISKCMLMGTSVATVCYNLRLKHPTVDRPLIDYDLALLIQLMLGISIGVIFNAIFLDWLVTVLLIILFVAAYGLCVASVAAIAGQNCVRQLTNWLGRTSVIIFMLAFMIFTSALTLGGVGIVNIVHKMERHQNMGFENLQNYGG